MIISSLKQLITNKIKSNYSKVIIFLVLLIFITNWFFIQTGLAQSLDSLEHKDLEVLLIDELQAEGLIDRLSNYDHVAVEQLSENEAQELLNHVNSENLSYSFGYQSQPQLSFLNYSCWVGLGAGILGISSVVFKRFYLKVTPEKMYLLLFYLGFLRACFNHIW